MSFVRDRLVPGSGVPLVAEISLGLKKRHRLLQLWDHSWSAKRIPQLVEALLGTPGGDGKNSIQIT